MPEAATYAPVRKGLVRHPVVIDEDNLDLLDGMAFVLLCVDAGDVKRPIVNKLEFDGIPFIDVGMGIYEAEGKPSQPATGATSLGLISRIWHWLSNSWSILSYFEFFIITWS